LKVRTTDKRHTKFCLFYIKVLYTVICHWRNTKYMYKQNLSKYTTYQRFNKKDTCKNRAQKKEEEKG